jgi:membrane protease YdiL (CAAX protease family)
MRALDWAWLVPVLLVVSILGFGLVGAIEPSIQTSLFGWLPDWYVRPLPVDDVASFTRTAWIVTLTLFVVLNVFAGPMVEELYFRGYLLPRMSRFGRAAPLLNAALFSLYHFWSPWQFLSRVAGVTPFAYGVWWKHNVYLGMAVHVLLNGIGTATVVALILGRLG